MVVPFDAVVVQDAAYDLCLDFPRIDSSREGYLGPPSAIYLEQMRDLYEHHHTMSSSSQQSPTITFL